MKEVKQEIPEVVEKLIRKVSNINNFIRYEDSNLNLNNLDNVISCPSWNKRITEKSKEYDMYSKFKEKYNQLPKIGDIETLTILNIIENLSDSSKAIVYLPTGFTFTKTNELRKILVDSGLLESIIALPPKLLETTGIQTSIIILSKNNKTVNLIDASKFVEEGRRLNTISDDNIDKIVNIIGVASENSDVYTIDDIKEKDYNLNPITYFNKIKSYKNSATLGELSISITRGAEIKANELDEITTKDETDMQFLKIGDIKDRYISKDLTYISEIQEKYEKCCIKNNSIVLSKSGHPFKIGLAKVDEGKMIVANGNLYIIEVDETKISPIYLKAFLESKEGTSALTKQATGTSLLTISLVQLKQLLVPMISLKEQEKFVNEYISKLNEIKQIKTTLEEKIIECNKLFESLEL